MEASVKHQVLRSELCEDFVSQPMPCASTWSRSRSSFHLFTDEFHWFPLLYMNPFDTWVSLYRDEMCMSFFGMQPTFTQVPPKPWRRQKCQNWKTTRKPRHESCPKKHPKSQNSNNFKQFFIPSHNIFSRIYRICLISLTRPRPKLFQQAMASQSPPQRPTRHFWKVGFLTFITSFLLFKIHLKLHFCDFCSLCVRFLHFFLQNNKIHDLRHRADMAWRLCPEVSSLLGRC